MKNVIESNYNIRIDTFNERENIISFVSDNEKYIFVSFNRTLKELNELVICCNELKKYNITTLSVILNKNNQMITDLDQKKYILLKCMFNYNDIVDLEEIIFNNKNLLLNSRYNNIYRNNWAKLWSDKLDYYEYQIRELAKDKKIVLDSYGYYAGLATNAIQLVNSTAHLFNPGLDKISLSHRRIFFPNYRLNYYNPLCFVFDLEVRDIAEYIKSCFFNSDNAFLDLETYLKQTKLTHYGYQMLYARLLYPSYYFDLYDKVMEDIVEQEELLKIISKSCDYELFLKKAYLEISKYAKIENIEWITMLEER